MGKCLTLYFLPGDRSEFDDFQRCQASLPSELERITFTYVLSHRDELDNMKLPETKWWGYLFGNEWFDEELGKALYVHLRYNTADCLTLFKKVGMTGEAPRVQLATRLYRTQGVPVLGVESYKNFQSDLTFEKVLDGWVKETDRV